MGKRKLLVGLVVLALATGLGGCSSVDSITNWFDPWPQKHAKFQHEAGTAQVAIISVARWDDYVKKLQPDFSLTSEEALAKAMPTTMTMEDRALFAMALQGKVATPQTLTTSKDTLTTNEQGVTSATRQTTVENKPGDLSQVPAGTTLPDKAPAAPSLGTPDLKVDPLLQYLAATALYQEVKVLNLYLENATKLQDHTPFLVRLQVSLMPAARNEPYDAYTLLSFFREPSGDATKTLQVVPLLVTDNLEMALAARSKETLLRLSLGLAAMQQGVGGSVNIDSMLDKIQTSLGHDLNSLFTVGRVSANTLRVRMGAYRQGPRAYTMVPRTHNITLLLLVPNSYCQKVKDGLCDGQLEVLAKTTFLDAVSGRELPARCAEQALETLRALAKDHLLPGDIQRLRENPCKDGSSDLQGSCEYKLASYSQTNNYVQFGRVASHLGLVQTQQNALWVDMMAARVGSQWGQVSFQVSAPPNKEQMAGGTAWLWDDGKNSTWVKLRPQEPAEKTSAGATTPTPADTNPAAGSSKIPSEVPMMAVALDMDQESLSSEIPMRGMASPRKVSQEKRAHSKTSVRNSTAGANEDEASRAAFRQAVLRVTAKGTTLYMPAISYYVHQGQWTFRFHSFKKWGLSEQELAGAVVLQLTLNKNQIPITENFQGYYRLAASQPKSKLGLSISSPQVVSTQSKGRVGIDLVVDDKVDGKPVVAISGGLLEKIQPDLDVAVAQWASNGKLKINKSGSVVVTLSNISPQEDLVFTPLVDGVKAGESLRVKVLQAADKKSE
jgi:hypothetical protein